MIKKIIFSICCLGAITGISQQQQQLGNLFSNLNLNNQNYVQRQSNPAILAANQGKINHQKKAVTNNQSTRRIPVQQNVSRNVNLQVQPLVQNEDVQQAQIQMNVIENNVGNEMSFIQQIAAVEIPAIQMSHGNIDMNLRLKSQISLPRLNLSLNKRTIKSGGISNSSKHKRFQFEKKLKRLNRRFTAKLKFTKKLKIKVDDCFKW